jgi:hypothetical protein
MGLSVFDHSKDFLRRIYVDAEKMRMAIWKELQNVEQELVVWGELKEQDRTFLAEAEYADEILAITINDYLPRRSHVLHNELLNRNWTDPITEAVRRLEKKLGRDISFEKAFCVIIAYLPRMTWWDPDNRAISKIINGLRYAGVVKKDTWDKMVFMVMGEADRERPRTEVYVFEQDRIIPVVLSAISIMKEKAKNAGGKTGVIHNF